MTLYQKLNDWEDRLFEGLIEDVILMADLQDAKIIRKLPIRDDRFMIGIPLLPPPTPCLSPTATFLTTSSR